MSSRGHISTTARVRSRHRSERADAAAEALKDAFGPILPRRAVCLGLGGLRSPNSQLQLLLFEAMTVLLDVRSRRLPSSF